METTDDADVLFRDWLRSVSRLCEQRFGLTLDDLPDMLTRDAFEEEVSPQEFFQNEVVSLIREEFGVLAEDLE